MKFAFIAGLGLAVAVSHAGPAVDAFRAGVDWSQRSTSSTIQITGTVSQTITGTPTVYGTLTKVAGSLNGSASLQALDPTFPIAATVFFTGSELTGERVRWAITCPGAIGQVITVEGVNITVTSVSGTYTAVFTQISPVLDPVSNLPRNVSFVKSAPDTNTLVIRGNVNGLPFLPVTATQTAVEYDGFAGGAGLGVVRGVAQLQGATSTAGLSMAVRVNSQAYTATVAANGSWHVITPFQGTHDVFTKLPTSLRQRDPAHNLSSGANLPSFVLLNGDCDGNDIVDIADYTVLASAFGAVPGDGNWTVQADLNRDQIVDIADYTLLSGNFSGVGD